MPIRKGRSAAQRAASIQNLKAARRAAGQRVRTRVGGSSWMQREGGPMGKQAKKDYEVSGFTSMTSRRKSHGPQAVQKRIDELKGAQKAYTGIAKKYKGQVPSSSTASTLKEAAAYGSKAKSMETIRAMTAKGKPKKLVGKKIKGGARSRLI